MLAFEGLAAVLYPACGAGGRLLALMEFAGGGLIYTKLSKS